MKRICAVMVVSAATFCHATTGKTTVVSPGEAAVQKSEKGFECAQPLRVKSADAIRALAYEEYRRRGGAKAMKDLDFTISSRGCRWLVLVNQAPLVVGSDMGIEIDGVTGKVIESTRGL